MLKLSEAQWRELQARDARRFVEAVADQFLSKRPEMLRYPGQESVMARMQAAHDHALRVGFTSTPHIVQLMHLYADGPRIHEDRLFDGYLRKPGATPEQRLDDLMAKTKNQLEGRD
jgi:hypothetical protein